MNDYIIEEAETHLLINSDLFFKDKIEEILDELSQKLIKRIWRHVYIEDLIYDYEPFNTEGYCIQYDIDFSRDKHLLQYYRYLIEKSLNQVTQLEKILELEDTEG